jgi:amidase
MAGYEPGDPWWAPPPDRPFVDEVGAPPGRLRVAVTATAPVEAPVDRECLDALAAAGELLAGLGHDVVEAAPPWEEDDVGLAFLVVWQVGPALQPVPDLSLLTPLNRELVESAQAASAADYARTVARLQAYARRVVAFWRDHDLVLTPTLAMPPVPIGWQEAADGAVEQLLRNLAFTPFTSVANLTGLPAMSLPLHWTEEGLPVGVQAIGPPAGDALLVRLAAQVEAARPWADRRPPID